MKKKTGTILNGKHIECTVNRTCGECVNSLIKRTEYGCDDGCICSKHLRDISLNDAACDNFDPLPF